MNLAMVFRVAFRALTRHKMRSTLTMLGIIIGVGSVITMVGVGQGARGQVQAQIAANGANALTVSPGSGRSRGMHGSWGSIRTLVYEDVEAVRQLSTVKAASARTYGMVQLVYGNQNWGTRLSGVEPVYFSIKEWPVPQGSSFTKEDVELANNVVVLGAEVKRVLFGEEDPIGKTVRIKNLPFRVVGVASEKGPSAEGYPQDDVVYMPYTTSQKKVTGTTWLNHVHVQAVSAEATALAQKQIEELLRDRHRIPMGQEDDFSVRNTADMAEMHDQAGRVMTLLLGAIASVSLLVGGIGIMNIMLVSVTERTREIGVRMAIGATEGDVQAQFLTEAVVLSVFGGALGIAFGLGAARILTNLLQWPSSISPVAMAAAVVFSAAIGIFFGLFPARRAAHLDPIEALRYE